MRALDSTLRVPLHSGLGHRLSTIVLAKDTSRAGAVRAGPAPVRNGAHQSCQHAHPALDIDCRLVGRAFEHSTSNPALDRCHDLRLGRHDRVLDLVAVIDDDEARLDRKRGTWNEDH